MFDETTSILEQVAARHDTTADAVRREIALALSQSHAAPDQSPEELIASAALAVLLQLPDRTCA